MTTETATIKSCCACGVSVSGQARMKDSQGKYWCIACGEADQRRKHITATSAPCAACRKSFPKGKLDKDGEWFFCKPCLKKRTKLASRAPVASESSGGTGTASAAIPKEKRKTLMLATVVLLLVVVSILFNFVYGA